MQSIPTLEEMTLAAINVLDENKNGFFLMSEGGAVDWVAHSNILSRTIEEQIDFNLAVEAACSWVEQNSSWDETLIIVTADHETGYLLGPNSNLDNTSNNFEKWKPIIGNGKGNMPKVEWFSNNHTNSLVPFYAKGNGSQLFLDNIIGKDPVYGEYIDNTAIGNIIKSFK
jgi:alkaline phosphatase